MAPVASPKSPVYANVALKSPTKSHNDDLPKTHTPSSPSIVTLKKTPQTTISTPPAAPQFANPHLKPSPGVATTSSASNNPPPASASPAFANVALKTTGLASLTSSTTNSSLEVNSTNQQAANKDKEPAYAKIALKSAGTTAAVAGSAPPAFAKVALKSAGGSGGGDDSVWRSSADKPSAPAYANLALKKTGTTGASTTAGTGSSNATGGSATPAYAGVALKSTGFVPTEANDGVPGLPGG